MNRALTMFFVCATAIGAAFVLSAQENDNATAAEGNTGGIDPALVKAATAKPAAKHFHSLFRLSRADAKVMVKLPRQQEFKEAKEGKFYPNGATFRISGGATATAEFEFGKDAVLKTSGEVEFGTREVEYGTQPRTVTLTRGAITVSLPRTLPTGLFSVAYPNFTVKDMAGESRHELTSLGDGDEAVVHVVTGMLALEGAHYTVARMSAADKVRIRTTGETLFTSMRGEAGDYKVSLDQGTTTYRDPISGAVSNQVRRLDFSLTPQCAIKIFRKRSQVGGRMVVSVMTFDPSGEMRNRFTFAEGAASVNFGEEVVRIQDISFKTKSDKKKDAGKKESGGGEAAESSSDESGSGSSSGTEESGSSSSEGGESNSGGSFGDNA